MRHKLNEKQFYNGDSVKVEPPNLLKGKRRFDYENMKLGVKDEFGVQEANRKSAESQAWNDATLYSIFKRNLNQKSTNSNNWKRGAMYVTASRSGTVT